ncbi:ParA family protein [bacterium]|nr:ParA family protein [bacterium]
MAKIIAIVNQKGGVGKTTTSINLAAYLAQDGKPTLLIDADPQANATSGIGTGQESVRNTVYDIFTKDIHPLSAVSLTGVRGLHVVPSTPDLSAAEIELVNIPSREYILKKSLDKVRNNYHYILIDCPPSLGLITVNALTASDKVIIPIQTEYYALEGLGKLLKTITLIKRSLNPQLEIGGALMTMHDKRMKLSRSVTEEVRKHFPGPVFDTIIPRNVKLAEAPSFGKSIFSYDLFSPGARAYKNLAREVQKNV